MAWLHTRWWLAIELTLLFAGLPLCLNFDLLPLPDGVLFPLLWLAAACCTVYLIKSRTFDRTSLVGWKRALRASRWIVPRFVACAALLSLTLYLTIPPIAFEDLPRNRVELVEADPMAWAWFGFVRWNPPFFALVMIVYPILSVIPQNLIYRVFFFHRYKPLLGEGWAMVLVGAAAFGLGHVMFGNWVAPLLTALGGVLMMDTYRRTRSGAASWLEHTLFGDFVWLIGIGRLFLYTG